MALSIDLEPESYSAWFTWARSKTYQGDVRKAVEFYQKACEARPECYRCDLIQMTMLASLGDVADSKVKARSGLRKAKEFLKQSPDENRALNMGAFALYRLGRVDEAKEWMTTSLANSARNSELTYNAASFYSMAGETNKSLEYLKQTVDTGCLNLTWLEQDSDLDHVRDNPRFKEIIERFKA